MYVPDHDFLPEEVDPIPMPETELEALELLLLVALECEVKGKER